MIALAGGLPKERFQVDFVLLREAGPLASEAESTGAKVTVLGWARRRRLHRLRRLWDVVGLARVLRRGKYDIVDGWMLYSYGVAALVKPLSFPILVTGRRVTADFLPARSVTERILEAVARRRADAVVAVSETVRVEAVAREGLDPGRIRCIRHGVALPRPLTAAERAGIRAGWGFRDRDVVVGCVANMTPRKGLAAVVRAVASLQGRFPNLRLVLVGDGPYRPVLESLIGDLEAEGIVHMHGRDPDARRLYGAFDIFAHASETEGGPSVVLEAGAAGRAIVATSAGGTVEAIVDGENGLLVPVGDQEALGAALARLAGDPGLRSRLGAAALERVAAEYSMERMVASFAGLYEELAERKGVRR